jgi:hypothetical protein
MKKFVPSKLWAGKKMQNKNKKVNYKECPACRLSIRFHGGAAMQDQNKK